MVDNTSYKSNILTNFITGGDSTMNENVNHPSHYNSGKIEVIDYIEDQNLGFHLGNAIKYICRAGKKDKSKTVEDLRKAIWYIERYISMLSISKSDSGD